MSWGVLQSQFEEFCGLLILCPCAVVDQTKGVQCVCVCWICCDTVQQPAAAATPYNIYMDGMNDIVTVMIVYNSQLECIIIPYTYTSITFLIMHIWDS